MTNNQHSTQEKILLLLKQGGGGLSVKDLCRELELSSMAVRRQLSSLEANAWVFWVSEKGPTGRPALIYYLTEKGHEQFPRVYAELADDLFVAIRASDGKEKIKEILEYRKQRQLEQARRRLVGKTLGARVHGVSRFLTEQGYMATWETVGSDQYLIKLMNCAVEKVARRFPQLCLCEEDFISELLEAKVTRQHHILKKEQFCSYLVESTGNKP